MITGSAIAPVQSHAFTAMTGWQAEDWFVEVRIPGFASHGEAEVFANATGIRLVLDPSKATLTLVDATGQAHPLSDEQVKVFRMKPEGKGEIMTTMDDFEGVPLRIAEFVNHPDLCRGFEPNFYAVE